MSAWAQAGAVTLGVLYAIGLLIVNVDLARYGMVNVDLARPEYVMAGGLWVVLTLMSAWGLKRALVATLGMVRVPRSIARTILGLADVVTSTLTGPLLLLVWILTPVWIETQPWRSVGTVILVVLANGLIVVWAAHRLGNVRGEGLGDIITNELPGALAAYVPPVFAMLLLYATIVYPHVPRQYGGGRKPIVHVFMTELPPVNWDALGYPLQRDVRVVGPVLLVLETAGQVVVAPPGTVRALAIDRRLISAVVFAPRTDAGLVPAFEKARPSSDEGI